MMAVWPKGKLMKDGVIISCLILALLGPSAVIGSDFEDEQTPIENDDIKTLDQVKGDDSFEDESTPIERDDIKTLDQIKGDDSFEDESTSIERDDIKTLDQIKE